MGEWGLLRLVIREAVPGRGAERIPETQVMDEAEAVQAFAAAADQQITAPTYLLHTGGMSRVIRPRDRVLDLGCGPAIQLSQLAALRTDADFVGIDLSRRMLAEAGRRISGLGNVELIEGDMTELRGLESQSFNAVVSSMTLHHLPDTNALGRTMTQVARVLKPGGGLYLADFVRLRSAGSMAWLAHRRSDLQSPPFTDDYRRSLRAAFSMRELRQAAEALPGPVRFHRTRPIPLMGAVVSPPRHSPTQREVEHLKSAAEALGPDAKSDLRMLAAMFRMGGWPRPW